MLSRRLLVITCFAVVFGALALQLNIEHLTFFVSDDAYYYLNVARNIIRGAGTTFDGLDPTNGYHPLWMLCLLPVYWLFGDSPDTALRAALMVQVFMVAAALWLGWDIFRRHHANPLSVTFAIALVCTLFSPLQIMFNGLETDLVVLLVVLIIHQDAKRCFLGPAASLSDRRWFGALLGLLVLARLDEAFLVVGIAIWTVIAGGSQSIMARIAALCVRYLQTVVLFTVFVAPYFLWNFAEFGHLTPISGALKATFPHPTFRPDVLVAFAPYVLCTLLAGGALRSMSMRPDAGIPRPNRDLLTGMWIGCLIQVCWAMFFTSWGTFQWHFAAHIPTAIIILSLYIPRLVPNPRAATTAYSAIALTAAVIAFNIFTYNDKGDFHKGAYAAAIWARTNTPKDSVFALGDAGVFGYFSERRTINLDGLINSYEYQHYVREGRVMDFLHDRHVAYVGDAFAPCSYSERHVWVRSFLPPRPPMTVAWGLTVARNEEVFRSADAVYRPLTVSKPMCFIVWPFDTVTLKIRDPAKKLGQF